MPSYQSSVWGSSSIETYPEISTCFIYALCTKTNEYSISVIVFVHDEYEYVTYAGHDAPTATCWSMILQGFMRLLISVRHLQLRLWPLLVFESFCVHSIDLLSELLRGLWSLCLQSIFIN